MMSLISDGPLLGDSGHSKDDLPEQMSSFDEGRLLAESGRSTSSSEPKVSGFGLSGRANWFSKLGRINLAILDRVVVLCYRGGADPIAKEQ
jgi:hypothetical protein